MPISSGIAKFLQSNTATLRVDTITDGEFIKRDGNNIISTAIGALGGGDVNGPAASSDNELPLFSGTSGKVVKRSSSLSGIVKLTSGSVSVITAPTGLIVGTSDTQTLTNKTLSGALSDTLTLEAGSLITLQGSTSGTPSLRSSPIGGSAIFQLPSTSGTHTLVDLDSIQTLTNKTIGASQLNGQVALNKGGTGTNLADPNQDSLLFWDDSASSVDWLTLGTNLTITGTVLDASGGGGSIGGSTGATDNAVLRANGTGGATIQSSGVVIDDSANISTTGGITSGSGGGTTGSIAFSGSTSGTINVTVAAVAGTHTIKLPTADGTNGQFLKTNGSGQWSFATPTGAGDFVGPGSATDNAIVRYDGTTGKLGQNSGATIDDSANISTTGTVTSGSSGATTGSIALSGSTSGAVTLTVANAAGTHTIKLPTADGTANQLLKTDGSGQWGWVTASGTGTVTNTGGNLTSNAVVLGAGTVDAKVVAGIITDGTSKLTLGVAGTSVGSVDFKNATSGTITLAPVTGALGTVTLSLPAITDTLVGKGTADTLTNKSINLSNNALSGTTAQFNTALSDNDFATLAGAETLSNKTLTAPKLADLGFIADANGNELLIGDTVTSAVNEITLANAATGSGPAFSATGGDTNVDINLVPKGTGSIVIGTSPDAGIARNAADIIEANNGTAGTLRDFKARNFLVGAAIKPSANDTAVVVLSDNTANPTMASNMAGLFGKDVSGTVEVFVIDEAGNATQISPHESGTDRWVFYSVNERTGRGYRVDMERLVQLVEQLSGEKVSNEWRLE